MRIYTKNGDAGNTKLLNNVDVSKGDRRIHLIGSIDEFNACLGVVLAYNYDPPFLSLIKDAQSDLFLIGSYMAGLKFIDKDAELDKKLSNRVSQMEHAIDILTEKLPPLTNFILPGGSVSGSQLHLARTICRKLEREFIENQQIEFVPYFNRFSDFLFTMARYVNFVEQVPEKIWKNS